MYPVDVVGGGTQGGVTIWGGGRVREDETRDHTHTYIYLYVYIYVEVV